MIKIYLTRKENLHAQTERILYDELGRELKILRTPAGKPYIEGDPVFISLSHSNKRGVLAICDSPVGVDLEYIRQRDYPAITSRFSEREKREITSREEFIKHWTAKEAFIKMHGYTLAQSLKYIEYCGGQIYYKEEKQPVNIIHYKLGKKGVICVCTLP